VQDLATLIDILGSLPDIVVDSRKFGLAHPVGPHDPAAQPLRMANQDMKRRARLIGMPARWSMSGATGRSGGAALSRSIQNLPFGNSKGFRLATAVHTSFVSTAMLPCVAREYGHTSCVASTSLCPTSDAMPGRLTFRRTATS
jgi:hypothetical protein